MKSMDDFDKFLKDNLQNTKIELPDNGFSEKVVDQLPKEEPLIRRNIMLYLACTIGVFIFVVSNGFISLLTSMMEFFSSGIHLIKPSIISVVIISAFIGISFCIARIEYDGVGEYDRFGPV